MVIFMILKSMIIMLTFLVILIMTIMLTSSHHSHHYHHDHLHHHYHHDHDHDGQAGHESHSVDQLTAACFEPTNQMVVCDPRAGKVDFVFVFCICSYSVFCIHFSFCYNMNITREVHGLHDALPGRRCAEGHQQGRRHHQDQEEYPIR